MNEWNENAVEIDMENNKKKKDGLSRREKKKSFKRIFNRFWDMVNRRMNNLSSLVFYPF